MKNNTSLIVIIVLLVAILCSLLGFVIGSNVKEKNVDTKIDEKDNQTEDKIPTLEKSEIEKLTKNILDAPALSIIMQEDTNIDSNLKLLIAYSNVSFDKEVTCNSIFSNNNDATLFGNYNYEVKLYEDEKYRKGHCNEKTSVVSYDKVNTEYQKLFGTNADKTNLSYGAYQAYYDKSTNQYIELDCNCSFPNLNWEYEINSFNQDNNMLNVNVICTRKTLTEGIDKQNFKLIFEYQEDRFIFKDIEKVS